MKHSFFNSEYYIALIKKINGRWAWELRPAGIIKRKTYTSGEDTYKYMQLAKTDAIKFAKENNLTLRLKNK